jgi:hypothetical protein
MINGVTSGVQSVLILKGLQKNDWPSNHPQGLWLALEMKHKVFFFVVPQRQAKHKRSLTEEKHGTRFLHL